MNKKAKPTESSSVQESNELTDKLDTVRDILFGAQVRETHEKSKALEALIESTAKKLQDDFTKQIQRVESNLAKLKENLAKQHKDTSADINRRFKEAQEGLEASDQSNETARNEIYEELSAELEALEGRAASWNEDLAKELETIHRDLLHAKTDRASLATMFLGMAEQLAPENNVSKTAKK